ncbi:MAG: tyrosine phosphatase family protein [Hyphomicrobiales bacterium]|nr:tyrosine phosphatase family protein [Hyphomicrobiales bacterium]
MTIFVCSLSRLHETVEETGARRVVTLINEGTPVPRPPEIAPEHHLFLGMNDINEPINGMTPPGEHHVSRFLDFVVGWEREAPMVVHCWAGISRSTAAAFIAVCALAPRRNEIEIATELRRKSPTATPNMRLVTLADGLLGRKGRMVEAVAGIGRGAFAFEGDPFAMPIGDEG